MPGLVRVDPERLVVVARSDAAHYGNLDRPLPAPELPVGHARTVAAAALRRLFLTWGLDAARAGQPAWNPLGEFCPPGSRVVLKPNWVLHFNQGGYGLDCLVTHPSWIEAVAQYLIPTRPARVVIGDAPVQGCDFNALRHACGLDEMAQRLRAHGLPVEIIDFRRTVLRGRSLGGPRSEGVRDLEHFVLFDLKHDSLLEPIVDQGHKLRVTMYNPDLLRRTHGPGKHQYLIAREVIEADVVINLPKLKSHKKAAITGALKNLIGINGNKEYLPHHRKGGGGDGGDCYDGSSWLKRRAEDLLDIANRRPSGRVQAALARSAEYLARGAKILGAVSDDLEGSWYGNGTIWRTCLDLQRILRYGRSDGALANEPQRCVLTLTDAIVGGEGEGPLANSPIPSAFVTGGLNTAAVEWVHARLMGFDPERIPLVREAFGVFSYPLAAFSPGQIVVRMAEGDKDPASVFPFEKPFRAPAGWRGYCEAADPIEPLLTQGLAP